MRQVQAIRHRHTRPYPRAPQLLQPGKLDAAKIAGHEREQNGQVYKITVGCDDLSLKEMLRLTWAAFVGTDQSAAIAGDVAMLDSEVTPVLKARAATASMWSPSITT